MKLIIAGSRNLNISVQDIYNVLWYNGFELNTLEIVSGAAKGPDSVAIDFARLHNMPIHIYPAKWSVIGKSAGIIRNKQMGDFADALIAFWDGESKGTKHMIDYMTSLNKQVEVVDLGTQKI